MRKVFSILLLFFSVVVYAQNNLPPPFDIRTDTTGVIRLDDAYWQMLEDATGNWTIKEVSRSPLADKFHANATTANSIYDVDYSTHTFWLRYRFKNSMPHNVGIILPKNVTYADLYTLNSDGNWDIKRTGTAVPWSKRNDLKRTTSLTYTIPSGGEFVVYERDGYDYSINGPDFLEIKYGFTHKVIQEYYNNNDPSILPSFLFGVFLLAALFNFYFFLIVRGHAYLFLSLTLLFRGISRFLYSNDVFLREYPQVKWQLAHWCGLFFFFFLIHFVRYFFETFKYFPRWDKFLIGVSIYFFIFFLLQRNDVFPFKIEDIIGPGIVLFSILSTLILFLRSGVRAFRLAIVAALPAIGIMTIPAFIVLFKLLNEYRGIPIPAFLKWVWVNERFPVLEQLGFVWLLIFFSGSLFQRYRHLQKQITQETLAKERLAKEKAIERNQLIAQQKVQLEKKVDERTSELKQSMEHLKATQAQLVQSEKMASLGELTAGIAHEIQNPLNFVNNFSETNAELVQEAKNELQSSHILEGLSILDDIQENSQKIALHGKRADSIVKSMLEHSRISKGEKQLTEINALVDEYLRLAYHGFRAKDKNFNATIQTSFDESISKMNIVPQEIGRVLLNLFNNAFYAVAEKKKQISEGYEPKIQVSSKRVNSNLEIAVSDNGIGISKSVEEKIFQPFFTTKPTGQGTGLGLSLSYDIVKALGGEFKVESKEGEGTMFTVILPLP